MIAILDSGVANLTSVAAAFERMNISVLVTADEVALRAASHVILPGVGSAGAAMRALDQRQLSPVVRGLKQPVLGICLGMQLLFEESEESDGTPCLGIIPGRVEKLVPDTDAPLPHMGWNSLTIKARGHPLLRDLESGAYMYFVHSYAVPVSDATLATGAYGQTFTAICGHKNFFGCQFHPERSGEVGARILKNFLEL